LRKRDVEGEPSYTVYFRKLTGGNLGILQWLCEDERNSLVFVGYPVEGSLDANTERLERNPLKEEGKPTFTM
jgi:predicted metal-dependent RNase